MPRIVRTASVSWKGNAARGTGAAAAGSGAFELPYSLPSRLSADEGKTSPEELLAAAHGACFAMSLSTELTRNGTPPQRLDVAASIVMDEVPGQGHLVVGSELDLTARVAGLDDETFQRLVREADQGCPFSVLLRASVSVTVRAQLQSS